LNTRAQSSLNLRFDLAGWGIHKPYSYLKNGSILKRKGIGYYEQSGSFQFKLNYKVRQSFGFETTFEINEQDICVYDKGYFADYGINKNNPNQNAINDGRQEIPGYSGAFKNYLGAGFACYKYFLIKPADELHNNRSIYIYAGPMIHRLANKTGAYTSMFHDSAHQEILTMVSQFKSVYKDWLFEAGYHVSGAVGQFYIGLRYAWSANTFVNGDYKRMHNNGTIISTDRLSVKSNHLALTLSVGPDIKVFESKRQRQLKRAKKDLVIHTRDSLRETIDKTDHDSTTSLSKASPGGRPLKVLRREEVSSEIVTVKIWDRGVIDGDRVTIFLNGEEIYHDLLLSDTMTLLELKLKPGLNELVMFAEDEGKIKPCTASLELIDGDKRSVFNLMSDERSSGCLWITRK